ncbi:hypothetical protein CEP49_04200 [Mergibacter septicus]|nr:hypothetical protein CEP49_04200 [Mergibacter septicus]
MMNPIADGEKMQYLFTSMSEHIAQHFKDYIQLHYHQVLLLKEDEQGIHVYLDTQAITNSDSQYLIQTIEQEAKHFQQNPFDLRYEEASWEQGKTQRLSILWRPWLKIIPHQFNQLQQALVATKFTSLITILCSIIYLLTLMSFASTIFMTLHFPSSPFSEEGLYQPWRYFSHAFVHLSIWHFLFNLTWWQIFAGIIERRCGSVKLVFLFLSTAILSGFAQYLDTGVNFFGLSGIVYAVLGYVLVQSRFQPKQFPLPAGFGWFLFIGIVSGFISPYFGVYFGNTAHISGLFIGCIWAWADILRKNNKV